MEQISVHYSVDYSGRSLKYTADLSHYGLNEYKHLSSTDEYVLRNKVQSQIDKWEEKWEKLSNKNTIKQEKQDNLDKAQELTTEAIGKLTTIDNLLLHTLSIDDTVDWKKLKDNSKFKTPNPTEPKKPIAIEYPIEPTQNNFKPKLSLFDKIITPIKNKKIKEAKKLYQNAHKEWLLKKTEINNQNEEAKYKYNQAIINWEESCLEWEKQKANFYESQKQANNKVDELKENYLKCDEQSIIEYCELVLNNSQYPDDFPKSFEIDYNSNNKILIVEYSLPPLEIFPTLNEVKYIATKNEFKEFHISDDKLKTMFDSAIYKITLRTLHELFEADSANAIDAISFNGWIEAINKANGKLENTCIISIQAKKQEFTQIDLRNVDPKTCFKGLKGVGSPKLSGITPVQPILQINRTDKRFVNNYEVANQLDDSTNLASMDWEDFEHLIREVFEKEFSGNGGEVKVTQASKDGGVDAIAFDPDPIRGGKIVIQAKRYTNTVGVSAVRDLYGTVMNEGATKGILVTTADFGADSYEFAKGKPLTLMNGANLLYLLERHGHKAKIDLKEAKRFLSDNK